MSGLVCLSVSFRNPVRIGYNSHAHRNIFPCAPDVFPMRIGNVNQPYFVTKSTVYNN
ncbi:MAG: hypothetical protein ACRCX4_05465 [Bacteroidales bacterium]